MTPYIHKVQYYETDKMKLTHHSNYIRIMEEARLDFLEKLGWPYHKFEEKGIISPVVSVTCDYIKTTTYPDVIEVEVKVIALKKLKFKLGYTMRVDGVTVSKGTSVHCFLDEKGKPVVIDAKYPELYNALYDNMVVREF